MLRCMTDLFPRDRRILLFLALSPLAFGALALFLGQDINWDLRNYHWYNAWALVTGRYARDLDLMPSQLQFFYNPLADVPFYFLGAHLTAKATFFILGAVQGLNFVLLFLLSHLTLPEMKTKTAACAALAALGMLSGMGISEIGTVFNDNTTSLGLLLALLLLLAQGGNMSARRTALAGVAAGAMAGLKLTCAPFCVGMMFALPALSSERRIAVAFGAGLAAGYLLTGGYWAYYLFIHTGNPLFPFFNSLFRSPLMPPVSISETVFLDKNTHPLLLPFLFAKNPLLVSDIVWRDWRVTVLYVLGPAALLWRAMTREKSPRDFRPAQYLLCMAGVSYFAWMVVFCIYRYLLPLDMLAPLLIALSCTLIPADRKTQAALALAALAVVTLSIRPGDWGRRHDWTEHVVEIARPALPPGAMVVMTGRDPEAYILSAFPKDASFVRLESLTFSARDDARSVAFNRMIRSRIDAHKGPLLLLVPDTALLSSKWPLEYFGLTRTEKACGEVRDLAYPEESCLGDFPRAYKLCEVTRRPAPPGKP